MSNMNSARAPGINSGEPKVISLCFSQDIFVLLRYCFQKVY